MDLELRLKRLERHNLVWKLLACAALGVAIWAKASAQSSEPRDLRAKSIALVDERGATRATLGQTTAGAFGIVLSDVAGHDRALTFLAQHQRDLVAVM